MLRTRPPSRGRSDSILEGDLVQDFLALGYAFLQIQLLTRQMRYSSSLDEVNFNQHLLAAAKAAVGGDEPEARNRLSTCFSLLAEERDHFYAVDAFLLDLTLLTPDLLGTPVQRELQSVAPVNLLLSGQLLEEIASRHPETLQALQAAVAAQRVGFAGGEHRELRLPLLSCESILAELLAGLRVFESQLGRRSGCLRSAPVRHDAPIAADSGASGIPRRLPRHAGRRAFPAWNAEQDPLGRRRRCHAGCAGQTAAGRQQAGNVSIARHEAGRVHGYGPRRDALLCPLGRGGQPLVRRPPPLCRLLFRPGTLPHR